jgi:hypothetical protein
LFNTFIEVYELWILQRNCPPFPLQWLFYCWRIKHTFVSKRNTILLKQENERFILQKVWNKIKFSIKSNNFQSLNFLRSKRRVKLTNCPSVLYSDLEVRKNLALIIKHLKCFLHFKFLTNLSIFGYSQSYSNEFLLKIETWLSLECDMSLFFSESHKCLKYLTKTHESDKPKYIFGLTILYIKSY